LEDKTINKHSSKNTFHTVFQNLEGGPPGSLDIPIKGRADYLKKGPNFLRILGGFGN